MRRMRPRLRSWFKSINPYVGTAALIALAVLAAMHLPAKTALASVGIILLMSVLAGAALWGLGPGLWAALLAGLALDYLFIPPIYSFNIEDWRNGFSWLVFGAASIAVCILADDLRRRTRTARQEVLIARRLRAMSRRLLGATAPSAIARITASALGATLAARVIVLIPKGDAFEIVVHPHCFLSENEHEVAIRQFQSGCAEIEKPSGESKLTCRLLTIKDPPEKAALITIGQASRRRIGLRGQAHTLDLFAQQAAAAFERAALSREVEEARIAAETEKLRSVLLMSMSHDLKAPLSIIIGAASALQALGSSMSQKSAQDLLRSIEQEGERLDEFIANLLDMSRLEAEAVRPKRYPVDIEDLVGSALGRAARVLGHHRIAVHLLPELPLLEIDPVIAQRVLFNVLDNAAKYTPEGSLVTLTAAKEGECIVLRILDEGRGIPESELPHIFDKFYRVDAGDGKPQGTGLGLAICRGFLEVMGGSISASNRRNHAGAIFTIKLPIATGLAAVEPSKVLA